MWFWICPKCGCHNGGGNIIEDQKCFECNYIIKGSPKKQPKIKKQKRKHICYNKVIEYRKQGLTYQEIGDIIGYSKQMIYNIANCK